MNKHFENIHVAANILRRTHSAVADELYAAAKELERLEQENVVLRSALDGLPVDAEGKPIRDGQAYYFPCVNGALKFVAYVGPQPEKVEPYPWCEGHSTREAAEAARSEQ